MKLCRSCNKVLCPKDDDDDICLSCFADQIHLEDLQALQAAGRGRGRGAGPAFLGVPGAPAVLVRGGAHGGFLAGTKRSMGRGDRPVTPRGRLNAIYNEMFNPGEFKVRGPVLPRPEELEDASSDGITVESEEKAGEGSDGEKRKEEAGGDGEKAADKGK